VITIFIKNFFFPSQKEDLEVGSGRKSSDMVKYDVAKSSVSVDSDVAVTNGQQINTLTGVHQKREAGDFSGSDEAVLDDSDDALLIKHREKKEGEESEVREEGEVDSSTTTQVSWWHVCINSKVSSPVVGVLCGKV